MDATIREPRRWTLTEYERLIEDGYFQPGERAELINGEILAMTPQKSRHSTAIRLLSRALERAWPADVDIRAQLPLAFADDSAPEPDIAVVSGQPRDYTARHPTIALLVVEVSDTTLAFDRRVKGPLFAKHGIADYWIANLTDGILEVYREPIETATGWTYRLVHRLGPDDTVQPLAGGTPMAVRDLLP
jgi:Uma2 family endonuclease